MALFFGLDIPLELQALFNALLSTGNNSTSLGSRPVVSSGDSLKRTVLNMRSLFVKWQSLYDGFDLTRRDNWQAYWTTLPFGSHSGANGWPGSGYSAFIYANAPRYKAGLDLLLDPPAFIPYDLITGFGLQTTESSGVGFEIIHYAHHFTATGDDVSNPEIGFSNTYDYLRITNVSLYEDFPATGPQLISNGDFSAGLIGWTRIEGLAQAIDGWCYFSNGNVLVQSVSLNAGYQYFLEFDYQPIFALP